MTDNLDDQEFCKRDLEKRFLADDELRRLCSYFGEAFQPDGATAALTLLELVERSVGEREPFSLIRVGNGEGNAISMTRDPIHPLVEKAFFDEFNSQNGIPIPLANAIELSKAVRVACHSADVIGVRCFRFDERRIIERCISQNNFYATFGLLYARDFFQECLVDVSWRPQLITSAWLHLDLLEHIDRLLNSAMSIIIITGRDILHEQFSKRLGNRLTDFISVPVQGFVPAITSQSHYARFPSICERLGRDLRGTLVLVGAGLFGKCYCQLVKQCGGVALDLGSAFDVLAGLETRPIHRAYDLARFHWV